MVPRFGTGEDGNDDYDYENKDTNYWAHNLSGKQVLHRLILYFYFRI